MRKLWIAILTAGLILVLLPALAQAETALFGSQGISPKAVRQGSLGSCYFYASVAALAGTQPGLLRAALQSDEDGSVNVRFADGKVEKVHLEDVQYARASGFDLSDGLWAGVLFRGYAQRTLRAALIKSINTSDLSFSVKMLMTGALENTDLLLLAYDRAIRSQIDQSGNISRSGLKKQLRDELHPLPIRDAWKEEALELLDTAGLFESLATSLKANGELFGAYRSAGAGGIPMEVLSAFTGEAHYYEVKPSSFAAAEIARALQNQQAVVASTGEAEHTMLHPSAMDEATWYSTSHAYTILSVDQNAGTITLRNPWGTHPDPEGQFTLSLESFAAAYRGLSISGPRLPLKQ